MTLTSAVKVKFYIFINSMMIYKWGITVLSTLTSTANLSMAVTVMLSRHHAVFFQDVLTTFRFETFKVLLNISRNKDLLHSVTFKWIALVWGNSISKLFNVCQTTQPNPLRIFLVVEITQYRAHLLYIWDTFETQYYLSTQWLPAWLNCWVLRKSIWQFCRYDHCGLSWGTWPTLSERKK